MEENKFYTSGLNLGKPTNGTEYFNDAVTEELLNSARNTLDQYYNKHLYNLEILKYLNTNLDSLEKKVSNLFHQFTTEYIFVEKSEEFFSKFFNDINDNTELSISTIGGTHFKKANSNWFDISDFSKRDNQIELISEIYEHGRGASLIVGVNSVNNTEYNIDEISIRINNKLILYIPEIPLNPIEIETLRFCLNVDFLSRFRDFIESLEADIDKLRTVHEQVTKKANQWNILKTDDELGNDARLLNDRDCFIFLLILTNLTQLEYLTSNKIKYIYDYYIMDELGPFYSESAMSNFSKSVVFIRSLDFSSYLPNFRDFTNNENNYKFYDSIYTKKRLFINCAGNNGTTGIKNNISITGIKFSKNDGGNISDYLVDDDFYPYFQLFVNGNTLPSANQYREKILFPRINKIRKSYKNLNKSIYENQIYDLGVNTNSPSLTFNNIINSNLGGYFFISDKQGYILKRTSNKNDSDWNHRGTQTFSMYVPKYTTFNLSFSIADVSKTYKPGRLMLRFFFTDLTYQEKSISIIGRGDYSQYYSFEKDISNVKLYINSAEPFGSLLYFPPGRSPRFEIYSSIEKTGFTTEIDFLEPIIKHDKTIDISFFDDICLGINDTCRNTISIIEDTMENTAQRTYSVTFTKNCKKIVISNTDEGNIIKLNGAKPNSEAITSNPKVPRLTVDDSSKIVLEIDGIHENVASEYLSRNNLEIVYQLETPIVKTLTGIPLNIFSINRGEVISFISTGYSTSSKPSINFDTSQIADYAVDCEYSYIGRKEA